MKNVLALILFAAVSSAALGQSKDFTRWVNPFIGTGGHGHTFPGATVPFGMVQLSPDTRIDNWDGSSGYHYSDDIIYGFSHTHLSGTGIPDGCDILFMPTTAEPKMPEGGRSITDGRYHQKFSHANERAEPGFYSVKLDDNILVELTATERVGFHRYRFPTGSIQRVIIDLEWRDRALNYWLNSISRNGNLQVEGYRTSSSWAKDQRVYFVAEFSRPFGSIKLGRDRVDPNAETRYAVLGFDERFGEELLVKVAISYVSIEGARKNLQAELPHWDFDKVRADAKAAWNKELSKIEVSGGTDEQTTNFYTALYHTMIHPNVFNDVDGKYLGHDLKMHQLPGYEMQKPAREQGRNRAVPERTTPSAQSGGHPSFVRRGVETPEHYTVFSLWDTFRAAHPLYTIIDQKRTADYINSFIRIYEQGGRLPVWELWGEETDTMIGYHSVSVIADAMAKGIKGFDYEKAYAAAKHSAELDHHGLAGYKRRGYVSAEDDNESVSKTLEYAYNDWCLMAMGSTLYNKRSLGKAKPDQGDAAYLEALKADIERYRRRAGNFENLFDTETRFFRAKRNGGFIEPFEPQEVTFHFTEGNSWQYSFFVPHDVSRLMHLMGGTEKFAAKLDELFTTETKLSGRFQPDITGLMGQYAHGNEPSHHIAYLYNYAGRPSKTQQRVRRIMDEFYKPTPDGLIGNEDCGQMSAWYVMSASGFYPVLPGDQRYDIGSPIFKEVRFNLENGKTFTVRAPNVSQANIYINSAKWNGEPHPATYITHDHMNGGGVLEFEMSATPKDKAFEAFSSASVYKDHLAVPIIEGAGRPFSGQATATLRSTDPRAKINYTIVDGSISSSGNNTELKEYVEPFIITDTATVRAMAKDGEGRTSLWAEARFTKKLTDWKVVTTSGYSSQYTGGGDDAIVDGMRGTANFASGEWQGYQGKVFEAVIDLKKPTRVSEVGGSFLQITRSWIWMPARIEFEYSNDGVNFTKLAETASDVPQTDEKSQTKEFRARLKDPVTARYVRVRAFNIGKIPAWHPGAAGDPWIFVDELFIQ